MWTRRDLLAAAGVSAVLSVPPLRAQRGGGNAGTAGPLPPAIAALKSRKSEAAPITEAERNQRFERARELMAKNKIEAICIPGGTTLTYFTGMRWGNSERIFSLVIPRRGKPFYVSPAFEEDRVREQVPGGKDARIYTWQEDDNAYSMIGKGLRDVDILSGSVGIEEKTPFVFADGIGKANPKYQVTNATVITAGCRARKSPAELALMRLACSVTIDAYEAAWKSCKEGMTTRAFSGLIGQAFTQLGFPGFASVETGAYSALPHGSVQPQQIKEGAIVLIDDGCTVEGYQSDISRTFVLGKPTDKMKRVFDIVHQAQSAALKTAGPGVQCQAVDAAARKVIVDAGFGPAYKYFTHRLGHGMGMDGHEWPYLVKGNTQLLEPGMVFSDEPGIYIPGEFGVRLEDDMVITEKGAELFTAQSPSLERPFDKA